MQKKLKTDCMYIYARTDVLSYIMKLSQQYSPYCVLYYTYIHSAHSYGSTLASPHSLLLLLGVNWTSVLCPRRWRTWLPPPSLMMTSISSTFPRHPHSRLKHLRSLTYVPAKVCMYVRMYSMSVWRPFATTHLYLCFTHNTHAH